MNDAEREFDIVLVGATGFTGRLTSEALVDRARSTSSPPRIALAARNPEKLEEVVRELGAEELPRIIVDSQNEESVRNLARRTRVVATTVGPYTKYGTPLVAACADEGTHYCDLTGEPLFIRRTIDASHERAQQTGARIVHCCGYDSIPSDLGTQFLQEEMEKRFGAPASSVVVAAGKTKGGMSGGTIASILHLFEASGADPALRKLMADPYALNPEGVRGNDAPDQMGVRYDPLLGAWTAPFIMAGINTKVVRRSHALLGLPWGEDFSYTECMMLGKGIKGCLGSAAVTAGLTGFALGLLIPPTRALLTKKLPKPGEGPTREQREAGFFTTHVVGTNGDNRLEVRVSGNRDPGYASTSVMLAESALCLSQDESRLTSPGGILTPATAMGRVLRERLHASGIRFDVVV